MRLNEPRRRRTVNLTPLIDVVFLLLVFFMLASTFLKFGTVKIETAGAGTPVTEISRIVLIHVARDGALRVAGRRVEAAALSDALRAAVADGKTDAVLVLTRGATTADLITALTRVRAQAFASVRVVD